MTAPWTVDVRRFKEFVWAVERENFRAGNALDALERARVRIDPDDQLRGAVLLSDALYERVHHALKALDAEQPGEAWLALKDAARLYDERGQS